MTALFEFAKPDAAQFPGWPCAWSDPRGQDHSEYRYTWWDVWDGSLPFLMVTGLNPSHANNDRADMTVNRCRRWALRWTIGGVRFGGVCMTNLFAYRSPKPEVMRRAPDPVGPENDAWLDRIAALAGAHLVVWGEGGDFMDRGRTVGMRFIRAGHQLYCIGTNPSGQPTHPAARGNHRVPDDIEPQLWMHPINWAP